MNVVYITNQPYPAGMAGTKRIRMLAEPMATLHQVEVLVLGSTSYGNAKKGKFNGVKYSHIPFSRKDLLFGFLNARKILQARFIDNEINAIVFYDGVGLKNFWFCTIGRKLDFSTYADVVEDYSVHEENASMALSFLHKVNAQIEKRYSKLLNGIAVISSGLEEKFLSLNMPAERIVRISVCAENYDLNLTKVEKMNEDVRFVYSGSFGVKDGVEHLVDAFCKLKIKFPEATLLLSGKINDKIASKIKGKDGIEYVGLVSDEDFYQFLQDADVLMMTRIGSAYANTGFPFKLGEYMATGNPVITTNVSDISKLFEDKKEVILVEPSNVSSLFKGMEYFMLNRKESKEIGARGKVLGASLFSPLLNGQKLGDFILNTSIK